MILAALVAALVAALLPAPASAGSEAYRIYLVQPEAALVESWEFEVLRGAWEPLIAVSGSLDPSDACLSLAVRLDTPGWIRSRSWGVSGEPSAWSRLILAPEPAAGLGLGLGALLVAALFRSDTSARRARRGAHSRRRT